MIGFGVTGAHNRRERRAQTYADSVKAVSEYLEGPYRVARCHDNAAERAALTTEHERYPGPHRRPHCAAASPCNEGGGGRLQHLCSGRTGGGAGRQMTAEWNKAPAKKHRDMNMHQPLDRTSSSAKREQVIEAMERDLGRRWWKIRGWFRA